MNSILLLFDKIVQTLYAIVAALLIHIVLLYICSVVSFQELFEEIVFTNLFLEEGFVLRVWIDQYVIYVVSLCLPN